MNSGFGLKQFPIILDCFSVTANTHHDQKPEIGTRSGVLHQWIWSCFVGRLGKCLEPELEKTWLFCGSPEEWWENADNGGLASEVSQRSRFYKELRNQLRIIRDQHCPGKLFWEIFHQTSCVDKLWSGQGCSSRWKLNWATCKSLHVVWFWRHEESWRRSWGLTSSGEVRVPEERPGCGGLLVMVRQKPQDTGCARTTERVEWSQPEPTRQAMWAADGRAGDTGCPSTLEPRSCVNSRCEKLRFSHCWILVLLCLIITILSLIILSSEIRKYLTCFLFYKSPVTTQILKRSGTF